MRHLWPIVAVVFALILAAQFFLPKQEATAAADRLEEVKKRGVLRCGYMEYPPYIHKDPMSGKVGGVIVDLMQEAARVSELKVEFVYETTWATALDDVNLGRFDVVCGSLWHSTKRAREALITEPWGYAIVTYYKNAKTDKTLDNGIFNALDGTYEAMLLTRLYGDRLQTLPDSVSYADSMRSVAQGKYDFMLAEDYVVHEYNKNNPDLPLIRVDDGRRYYMPWVFIVGKNQFGLLHFVNAALKEIRFSGAADEVWRKHNTQEGNPLYVLDVPKG